MLEQLLKSLQGPSPAMPQTPGAAPGGNAWTPSTMPSGMEGATRRSSSRRWNGLGVTEETRSYGAVTA